MRSESSHSGGPLALLRERIGAPAPAGASIPLPRPAESRTRFRLSWLRAARTPLAGRAALAALMIGSLTVVLFATAGPSVLVPRSEVLFPNWLSGPLHEIFGHLDGDPVALKAGLSLVMVVMLIAYGVALAAVRTMSMRNIALCVVALHAIFLLGPPLPLTDVFNYLGYARLGALHHLNPYTHVIGQALHDPVYRFTTWHHLRSPYGPMFSAASYPLAFLPLPVAYWLLKIATMLASLGVIALVWRCARQLGRDPRFAVLFLAVNPVVLIYGLGGFHNDVFMLLPSMAAISLLLARRDRSAGAMLMLAVTVKFTAVLLLPFLLIAVRPRGRRLAVLAGAALAALPLVAGIIALFGLSIPNLSDQSTLLTNFSIPNVAGLLLGVGGGASPLLRVANVLLVLAVAYNVRRQRDWLVGAGWSTLALIASLAWLVPWYVIWLLPLAGLGTSVRLRRAALVTTAYLVLTFMPLTGIVLNQLGLDALGSSVGQASTKLQQRLEQ